MRLRDTPQSARPGRLDLTAGVNLTPMPHWTIRVGAHHSRTSEHQSEAGYSP